ncbi:MAG: polysaccharide deacetylase family protein, partial [Bryobacteraceae bacterium]|nr:polysaccharide deacetylase family protein [Bryobacteraceae bacterium]
MRHLLFFLLPLLLAAQTPPKRHLTITIDDLPRGGDSPSQDLAELTAMTRALTSHLRGTHAIGFVNPGSVKSRAIGPAGLQSILKIWRGNKLDLGNHTSTHPSLHRIPLADYIKSIEEAEPAITQARGGQRSVFFRHTFLHTGLTLETK